jgi:hypothetical protein
MAEKERRGQGGGSGSRWRSRWWRGGKGEEEGSGSPMCARWWRGLGIGEAVNESRREVFLTGRGGPTEVLPGVVTVALSFRSVVEREQPGRRASAWDNECRGGVGRRVAHQWAEFNRCGRGATTRKCRRKGARDGDLAGVWQLVDRLRCEEGGWNGMAVVDSDEELWAQTSVDGCSGGAAPGSSSLVLELMAQSEELGSTECSISSARRVA